MLLRSHQKFVLHQWFTPCLRDLKRDYADELRRLQRKLQIPGSEWDVGAFQRMQRLAEQPRGAANLTGPVEIRAAAEAAVLNIDAERRELKVAADELGIPDDLVGVDAYIIGMYRRCLGGPYNEGAVRSQRGLLVVCLDSPFGNAGANGRPDTFDLGVPTARAVHVCGSQENVGDTDH